VEELNLLLDRRDFNWAFVGDSFSQSLQSHLDDNRRLRRQLEDLKRQYEELVAANETRIEQLRGLVNNSLENVDARIERTIKEMQDRCQATLSDLAKESEAIIAKNVADLRTVMRASEEATEKNRQQSVDLLATQSQISVNGILSMANHKFRINSYPDPCNSIREFRWASATCFM
jgi:hypothetical protein